MWLYGHKIIQFVVLSVVLLMASLRCQAQEVVANAETDRAMTGAPIFSHGMYYTGMVNYDGEMIPSFLFAELPTKKEKDAYLKQQEKELKAIYYPQLKKLTFAQGKLLIKLIDRQCDMTGYDLIKKYMGSFKAGFYNAFASLFGASLKKEYDPEVDDRLTERAILLIESGQM